MKIAETYERACSRKRVGAVINMTTIRWDQHARTCKCEAARRLLNDSDIELSCPMCIYSEANLLPSKQTVRKTMSSSIPNLESRSCYKCRMPGHLIRNCPLNVNRNNTVINRISSELSDKVQQTQRTLQHVQEIYGTCRIDDNLCSYLLDTGSNRSVVNRVSSTNERVTHEIAITCGSQPIKQKTRGIPYNFREEFRKTIKEMKAAGMIDSKSRWCSPVRLIRKKDGTIRICVDFRKVNNVTVKDAYPIPKIYSALILLHKRLHDKSICVR